MSGTKAELLARLSDADKLSTAEVPLLATSAPEDLTAAQVVPSSSGASADENAATKGEASGSRIIQSSSYARAPDDPTGDSFADISAIEALILERQQAREARNFKQADKLRAELYALGVEVGVRKENSRISTFLDS